MNDCEITLGMLKSYLDLTNQKLPSDFENNYNKAQRALQIASDINSGFWKKAIMAMEQEGIAPEELRAHCNELDVAIRNFKIFSKVYGDKRNEKSIFFKMMLGERVVLEVA